VRWPLKPDRLLFALRLRRLLPATAAGAVVPRPDTMSSITPWRRSGRAPPTAAKRAALRGGDDDAERS